MKNLIKRGFHAIFPRDSLHHELQELYHEQIRTCIACESAVLEAKHAAARAAARLQFLERQMQKHPA